MKTEGWQYDNSVARNVSINWVMLIYFCSGVCSLIDEVVWVRLLKLTLGNTVYASSIVVSVFMGGLALGALVMGRYADRVRRRLRLYALLEVIATISALSLPWILGFADGAYRWFFVKYQPAPAGLLAVQVIISAGVLLVPTMVMGSTLPLLGRYVTALQNRVGPLVGRLYALNMLGAALGCFLAGFVLIRVFGVMGALYIAAGINLLVAFGGWVLSRFYDVSALPAAEVATVEKPAANVEPAGKGRIYLLMSAFFLSGLISIGYEIIWIRSIVFRLGGYTYVFSAVLTIYLLGNVIGVWIGSRLSKRLKHPARGFAVSLSCLGILGIFYIPWLSIWHLRIVSHIQTSLAELLNNSVFKAMVWPLFQSIFLFLLPAVIMGIGFPLALQAWGNLRHKVGRTTATVYGVNTIGAVLGGLASGFLLIPLMGVQLSITVLGLAGLWLGVTMIQVFTPQLQIIRRMCYLSVAAVLTITAVIIPSDLFRYRFVQRGDSKLLAVKEGVTTTVSVHEGSDGALTLATSGIAVAGDIRGSFRIPQKFLGHLGILLNKNTKRVLSVGFGSGETIACMSRHNLESIEGVEISPEVVEVSLEFFEHINLGGRLDEKVNMIYMDAKNYLHLTDRRYDLIVNDSINPKQFAENASLYTKEYFQDAMEHLRPGGIFASFVPIGEISVCCIESILGTFAEVFPYVTIWFPITAPSGYNFFYLAGSREPQLFSPRYIDEQLKQKSIRESAGYINFRNSQYVLSCYIGDRGDLKRYLGEFHLNSDFRPYVEFSTDVPINVPEERAFKSRWLIEFIEKIRSNSIFEHMDWMELSQNEQEEWRREYELFCNVSYYLLKPRGNFLSQFAASFGGLRLMPEHAGLLEQKALCLSHIKGMLKEGMADGVIAGMVTILQHRPEFADAWLAKSWALQERNELNQALSAAEKAVQYAPSNAQTQKNLGVVLLRLEQTDKAISHFSKAIELEPTEADLHYNLGVAFSQQKQFDQAISQFRQGLQFQPRDTAIRYYLANILFQQGRKDEAVREFREVLRIDPTHPSALNGLNTALAQ